MHEPLFQPLDNPVSLIRPLRPAESTGLENNPEWQLQRVWETNPREACEALFRKYYVALCSHASRFVYSKEVAEDIVSEVFYQFYKEKLYKTIKSSYKAYLMQAVRYRAYDYIRWELSKSRRGTDVDLVNLIDHEPSPSEIVQYDELYQSIELAINQLPPQTKRVFLLSRFEGRKYQEIAGELAISVKTVETHMSKALSLLRQAVRPLWTGVLLLGLVQF
ncbi:RNA polymerase sigma-70 factor (ECF subfamily) [Larkinella arboricola]|uniref:RNA polymerase sigma-70 factor (ECF subfamily) n=1 Tax=Larkinella arboricola TaxID=643671 RepID=A0A327WQG7_LARAB|nr:RNA polymerase sigma-70 factor [Larkinella arboricola]RAJ93147.1 RNA polymerase sigma-70 factor (ECF subfamily) [Larkinella arboricola]